MTGAAGAGARCGDVVLVGPAGAGTAETALALLSTVLVLLEPVALVTLGTGLCIEGAVII